MVNSAGKNQRPFPLGMDFLLENFHDKNSTGSEAP